MKVTSQVHRTCNTFESKGGGVDAGWCTVDGSTYEVTPRYANERRA